MAYFGKGYCAQGKHSGWYSAHDDKQAANVEECNKLCLEEDQCKFASYYDDGHMKTCNRYSGDECILVTSTIVAKKYNTSKKNGLFVSLHSNFDFF